MFRWIINANRARWRRATHVFVERTAQRLQSRDLEKALSAARDFVDWDYALGYAWPDAVLEAILRVSLRERVSNPRNHQVLRRHEKRLPTRGPIFYVSGFGLLEPALRHVDPTIRAEALLCISEFEDWPGPEEDSWERAAPLVFLLLQDPEPVVREAAMEVMAGAGWPEAQSVLPLLRQRLNDPDPVMRADAARSLYFACDHVPEVEQWLEPLKDDPDEMVRFIVSSTLSRNR